MNNIILNKGYNNKLSFIIKEPGTAVPITLDTADKFVLDLINLDTDEVYLSKALTVDTTNNKVVFNLNSTDSANLVSTKGNYSDKRYLVPSYRAIISCSTANQGDFSIGIPEIYVN